MVILRLLVLLLALMNVHRYQKYQTTLSPPGVMIKRNTRYANNYSVFRERPELLSSTIISCLMENVRIKIKATITSAISFQI